MSRISDLVQDAELQTRFEPDCTIHVYSESGQTAQQRLVLREERWKRKKLIGGGSYGSVWLELCISGQSEAQLRAVKQVLKAPHVSKKVDYARELEAISKFSHRKYDRCFVKSFGWYEDAHCVFIAMEYFEHGDFQQYLKSAQPFPESEAQQITFQVLEGLHFMHTNGYSHRDVKPGNILIRSKPPNPWWVKLSDFGISKRAADNFAASSTLKGTLRYMAPELLGFIETRGKSKSRYAKAADMWALGEITFQMLTQKASFEPLSLLASYEQYPEQFPTTVLVAHNVSVAGITFVRSLMQPRPEDRQTTTQALQQNWMLPMSPVTPVKTLSLAMEMSLSMTETTTRTEELLTIASAKWSTVSMPPPPLPSSARPAVPNSNRHKARDRMSTILEVDTATPMVTPTVASETDKIVPISIPSLASNVVNTSEADTAVPNAVSLKTSTANGVVANEVPVTSSEAVNVIPDVATPTASGGDAAITDVAPPIAAPNDISRVTPRLGPPRFYIMKSYNETNIETSAAHGIWCCNKGANTLVSNAFNRSNSPIYLFFSVNGSRQFCGVAEMMSAWRPEVNTVHWEDGSWEGGFEVEWLSFSSVKFDDISHLKHKEVGNGMSITMIRFVLELCTNTGMEMMRRFGLADLVETITQPSNDLTRVDSLGLSGLEITTDETTTETNTEVPTKARTEPSAKATTGPGARITTDSTTKATSRRTSQEPISLPNLPEQDRISRQENRSTSETTSPLSANDGIVNDVNDDIEMVDIPQPIQSKKPTTSKKEWIETGSRPSAVNQQKNPSVFKVPTFKPSALRRASASDYIHEPQESILFLPRKKQRSFSHGETGTASVLTSTSSSRANLPITKTGKTLQLPQRNAIKASRLKLDSIRAPRPSANKRPPTTNGTASDTAAKPGAFVPQTSSVSTKPQMNPTNATQLNAKIKDALTDVSNLNTKMKAPSEVNMKKRPLASQEEEYERYQRWLSRLDQRDKHG